MSAELVCAEAEKTTTYDVYFGTADPPIFCSYRIGMTFDRGSVDSLMTYFWRVDARNGFGATAGGLYRFTTGLFPGDFDEALGVGQSDLGRL